MNATDNLLLSARASVRLALLLSAGLLVGGLAGCCTNPPAPAQKTTFSSFDTPTRRTAQPEFASGGSGLEKGQAGK